MLMLSSGCCIGMTTFFPRTRGPRKRCQSDRQRSLSQKVLPVPVGLRTSTRLDRGSMDWSVPVLFPGVLDLGESS